MVESPRAPRACVRRSGARRDLRPSPGNFPDHPLGESGDPGAYARSVRIKGTSGHSRFARAYPEPWLAGPSPTPLRHAPPGQSEDPIARPSTNRLNEASARINRRNRRNAAAGGRRPL
jgi:hypothetical protein